MTGNFSATFTTWSLKLANCTTLTTTSGKGTLFSVPEMKKFLLEHEKYSRRGLVAWFKGIFEKYRKATGGIREHLGPSPVGG
jgi:hypothetical protein